MEEMIDRVFTREDAKLLEKVAVVAILDGEKAQAEFIVQNPVPIINEHADTIGSASLELLPDRRVQATMYLNRNTPDIFEMEQGVRKFYPFLLGATHISHYQGSDVETIVAIQVGDIQIMDFETEDDRIKPL